MNHQDTKITKKFNRIQLIRSLLSLVPLVPWW